MNARSIVAALLVLCTTVTGANLSRAADPPPPPPLPPAAGALPPPAPAGETQNQSELTPPRLSYVHGGEVSFWRPGAEDWTPARVNTPLAPGDVLYAGRGTTIEIQVGPRAFLRAAEGTQIGLDDQDDDLVQFRVTAGHVGMDVREMPPGQAVELATPNAAFTVERAGYYRLDVGDDSSTFRAHRAGRASVIPASGTSTVLTADQQAVVSGDGARVQLVAAPELTAWDRWNDQRTNALAQSASVRYVGTGVYGAEQLDQHGSWRAVETYGNVWVPSGVASGWSPYTTGRWIWDPRYGWTWLDDAPWGWAPYHYGRWVYAGSYWAWAPGPIVVRPVYAPALVVFLGGPVRVSIGRPVAWAPLGWGEPVTPWWGRPGFVGRPYWGGWGGPRVVNNVVVHQTNVNVTNINVYRNVNVTNAVVGVPADRFGHGQVRPVRLGGDDVRQLTPVRGGLEARPVAASVAAATGQAARPPEAVKSRAVVATRAPRDYTPALRAQGLEPERANAPAPRVVPVKGAPGRERAAESGQPGRPGGERPGRAEPDTAKAPGAERQTPPAAPGAPGTPGAPAMGKGRADDGPRPDRGGRGQGKDDQPTAQPDRRARQTPPPVPQPVPQTPAAKDPRPEPKDDRSAIPNDPTPDRRGRQTAPPPPQSPAPKEARPEPKDDRSTIPNDAVRRQDQQRQQQQQQRQEQQRQARPPQPPSQPQVVPQAPPPPKGERPDQRDERQQQPQQHPPQQRQARPPQPAQQQPQPQIVPQAPPPQKGDQREERQQPQQRQEQRGRPEGKEKSERPDPRADRQRAASRIEAPAAPAPRAERVERIAPGQRVGNPQTPPAARPAPAPAIEQRGERPAGHGKDREPGAPRPRGRGDG
jgi:hypothetical protein